MAALVGAPGPSARRDRWGSAPSAGLKGRIPTFRSGRGRVGAGSGPGRGRVGPGLWTAPVAGWGIVSRLRETLVGVGVWMRALQALAGAGVSVVLAAGCTGGSAPAPSPSTSPSASTSPSPSVTPSATPSVPAAARAHTKAGAEAFVRFYIDLVNRGVRPRPRQAAHRAQRPWMRRRASNFTKLTEQLRDEGHGYAPNRVPVDRVGEAATGSATASRYRRPMLG